MNKLTIIGLVVVAIVAIALVFTGGVPGSNVAQAEGALVIKDGGCDLFDGDGNLVAAHTNIRVFTKSENGNSILVCHAKGLTNSTGKAVRYDTNNNPWFPGLGCNGTTTWHETVSASGNATIVCNAP